MKKGRGVKARPPTPEELELIASCKAYADKHGLAYKTVPMPFPEARIGLRVAPDGDLDPVVVRFRILKRGPMLRAYSTLRPHQAEPFGASEARIEGRMQSQTLWQWPIDQSVLDRFLGTCVEFVRQSNHLHSKPSESHQ